MVDDADPAVERIEGETPGGGVASIAYFLDADWSPVPKSKAVRIEIHEIDAEGNIIERTYLDSIDDAAEPTLTGNIEEAPVLSDEDEAVLDAVWDRLAAEE